MQPLQERQLSALALSTHQLCPLRFRYRYIDNLFWSRAWGSSPEERKGLERGQNFHLMARRYYAGVDPGQVADPVEQTQLDSWLAKLQGFLPRTFDRQFYPELELRLNRPDMRLMSKFDLLVVDPDGRATIFDWKTEKRLPRRSFLTSSYQTLVYRFMLCAAGGAYSPKGRFHPDDVSMIYWNPNHEAKWERLQYSETQYQKDEEHLQRLIALIMDTPRDEFRATPEQKICRSCEYQMICHGRRAEQVDLDDEESDFEQTLTWEMLDGNWGQ